MALPIPMNNCMLLIGILYLFFQRRRLSMIILTLKRLSALEEHQFIRIYSRTKVALRTQLGSPWQDSSDRRVLETLIKQGDDNVEHLFEGNHNINLNPDEWVGYEEYQLAVQQMFVDYNFIQNLHSQLYYFLLVTLGTSVYYWAR